MRLADCWRRRIFIYATAIPWASAAHATGSTLRRALFRNHGRIGSVYLPGGRCRNGDSLFTHTNAGRVPTALRRRPQSAGLAICGRTVLSAPQDVCAGFVPDWRFDPLPHLPQRHFPFRIDNERIPALFYAAPKITRYVCSHPADRHGAAWHAHIVSPRVNSTGRNGQTATHKQKTTVMPARGRVEPPCFSVTCTLLSWQAILFGTA